MKIASYLFFLLLFVFTFGNANNVLNDQDESIKVVNSISTRYYFDNNIDFKFTSFLDDKSSGEATISWGPTVCKVVIDPQKAQHFWNPVGDFKYGLLFVSIHETAHCLFYKHQELPWKKVGYKGSLSDKEINEYLVSEAINSEQERVNFLGIAHEAYADAFAIQTLNNMGVSMNDLVKIRKIRNHAFDRVHDVAAVYDIIKNGNYKGRDPMIVAEEVTAIFMLNMKNFSAVMNSLQRDNLIKMLASDWCYWSSLQKGIIKTHYFLGEVKDIDYFYPNFLTPKFIYKQINRFQDSQVCNDEVMDLLINNL